MKPLLPILLSSLLALTVSGCSDKGPDQAVLDANAPVVAMSELIKESAQFTGKTITITGRFGGMCADGADFYFKDKLDLIEVIPPAAGLPDDVVIGTPLKIQGVVMVRGEHEEEGEEQERQERKGEAGDEADHETTGESGNEVEPEVKIRAVVIHTNRS